MEFDTMNIQFLALKDSDFPEVKRIYDWYIANSTATFHTEPIAISELKEFIYVDHSRYKAYLIKLDGQIAGYCYFTYYKKRQAYDRTAEITLYLDHEQRGKGIGKTAIRFLENNARELGLKNLLAIITGDNSASISLFSNAGYTKCADFKNVGEKFGKILDVVGYQKEL
jgi:phosphinothricin acetyltransferase